jgi:hypothetical protein
VRAGRVLHPHSHHETVERGDARHLVGSAMVSRECWSKVSYSGACGDRYEGCTREAGQADRATPFGERVSVRVDHCEPVLQEKACLDPIDGSRQ